MGPSSPVTRRVPPCRPIGHLSFIHLSKPIVPIANPIHANGSTFTSPRRAAHFVRSGRAELLATGELFFFDAATVLRRQDAERERRLLEAHRSGVVYWNGSGDVLAMHRPGEARS